MNQTRRDFIKKTALMSVAPMVLPSHLVLGDNKPSNRVTMGFIGTGKQNGGLMRGFMSKKNVQVLAVCDVDKTRREHTQNRVNSYYKENPKKGTADCSAYNDFRKLIVRDDIDAVCISTPDHWHAYPTVMALRSGKDVYCEKPLTHTIHEAVTVMETVKKTDRILQTGSMQRSMAEFRVACELVRNGIIGKVSHIECSFGPPGKPCDLPEEPMEPGLDWNMWVGPAPMRPYNSILSPRGVHKHYPNWRNYREFAGGMVCDWGAHHLDIAQWALDMDDSGPVEILPPAKKGDKSGATLVYANGVRVIHKGGYGVHVYGDKGEVKVNRGRFELILDGKKVAGYDRKNRKVSLYSQVVKTEKEYLKDAKIKLYNSKNHLTDFMDCIASRKKPITSEIVGGRTAICCHLMNQAYYNHARISWDPQKLAFTKGTGHPDWLTKNYRGPWSV